MTMLLKLGAINGECKRDGYDKWIEVDSLQFGVGRGISSASGATSRQASEPSVSEVVFTKSMTIDSGDLFFQSLCGTGVKAEFHVINTNSKTNKPYFTVTLEDTMISGYSVSSGGDRPSESISLNFTKIAFKYDQYDGDTVVASGTEKKWSLTTSKEY